MAGSAQVSNCCTYLGSLYGLGIFVVTGVWISLFAESLHRAKHEAEYRLAERKLADER